jgi:hypothetical protein
MKENEERMYRDCPEGGLGLSYLVMQLHVPLVSPSYKTTQSPSFAHHDKFSIVTPAAVQSL